MPRICGPLPLTSPSLTSTHIEGGLRSAKRSSFATPLAGPCEKYKSLPLLLCLLFLCLDRDAHSRSRLKVHGLLLPLSLLLLCLDQEAHDCPRLKVQESSSPPVSSALSYSGEKKFKLRPLYLDGQHIQKSKVQRFGPLYFRRRSCQRSKVQDF